jgi:LPXTG-motif cell wall-anchored protein
VQWDFADAITADTTLYAQWTRVSGGDPVDPGGPDDGAYEGADDGRADDPPVLPDTGSHVSPAVLPGALTMILLGMVLLLRNRRRVDPRRLHAETFTSVR